MDILGRLATGYEIWAFGSRVTGNNQPFSDLDICLKPIYPQQGDDFGILEILREEFENSNLSIFVDIVVYSRLSDEFKEIIKNSAIRLL